MTPLQKWLNTWTPATSNDFYRFFTLDSKGNSEIDCNVFVNEICSLYDNGQINYNVYNVGGNAERTNIEIVNILSTAVPDSM